MRYRYNSIRTIANRQLNYCNLISRENGLFLINSCDYFSVFVGIWRNLSRRTLALSRFYPVHPKIKYFVVNVITVPTYENLIPREEVNNHMSITCPTSLQSLKTEDKIEGKHALTRNILQTISCQGMFDNQHARNNNLKSMELSGDIDLRTKVN